MKEVKTKQEREAASVQEFLNGFQQLSATEQMWVRAALQIQRGFRDTTLDRGWFIPTDFNGIADGNEAEIMLDDLVKKGLLTKAWSGSGRIFQQERYHVLLPKGFELPKDAAQERSHMQSSVKINDLPKLSRFMNY